MGVRETSALFRLSRPLSGIRAKQLRVIPGVKLDSNMDIIAPIHGMDIVKVGLQRCGIPYAMEIAGGPNPIMPAHTIPGLSEYFLKNVKPFQLETIDWLQARGGGGTVMECGGGKTWVALAYILAFHPDPVILVSTTGSLLQWEDEIRVLTDGRLKYHVLEKENRASVSPATQTERSLGWPEWKVIETETGHTLSRHDASPQLLPPGIATAWAERLAYASQDIFLARPEVKTKIFMARLVGLMLTAPVTPQEACNHFSDLPPDNALLQSLKATLPSMMARLHAEARVHIYQSELEVSPDTSLILVPWSILPARRDALAKWSPQHLILDEAHYAKDNHIWTAERDPDSDDPIFVWTQNQAASARMLSQNAQHVVELSATPADRVRDWWNLASIIDPRFGTRKQYGNRYCNGHNDETYNFYNDKGSDNKEELRARLQYLYTFIPKKVSHAGLAPLHIRKWRIPARELRRSDVMGDERGAWNKARQGGKGALIQHKSFLSAAMKRPVAIQRAMQRLRQAQSVIILTGFIKDCERLVQGLKDAVAIDLATEDSPLKDLLLLWGHGESHSPKERRSIVNQYLGHFGKPTILIGTIDCWGQSYNLQRTHLLILTVTPWSIIDLQQTIGRIHRHGMPPGLEPEAEILIGEGTVDIEIDEVVYGKYADLAEVSVMSEHELLEALHDSGDGRSQGEVLASLAQKIESAWTARTGEILSFED